jgi:hypothetical protein
VPVGRRMGVAERKRNGSILANVGNECGTEAYEASAVRTADAWIYDSGRARD